MPKHNNIAGLLVAMVVVECVLALPYLGAPSTFALFVGLYLVQVAGAMWLFMKLTPVEGGR